MRHAFLIAAACLFAFPASAAVMRDYSLTPEETLRESRNVKPAQPDSANDPFQQKLPQYDMRKGGRDDNYKLPAYQDHFMDTYCDPNFRTGLGTTSRKRACLDDIRKEACDHFRHLPGDARDIVNHAMNCIYATDEETGATLENCDGQEDTHRMRMLQKYWHNQEIAYAIVFLPEMVLNAASFCTVEKIRQ